MEYPMQAKNWIFERAFPHIFTFTILFEDCEVEERHFGIDDQSSVLAISGAGCGIASMVARRPRRIDAVDSNRCHLALTALKVLAAMRLRDHGELYQMFGHGRLDRPEETLRLLTDGLPEWIQRYWRANAGWFKSGIYTHGLLSRMFRMLRVLAGTDAGWVRRRTREPTEQRVKMTLQAWGSAIRKRPISSVVNSPLLLAAQGINFRQRDRNVRATGATKMSEVVLDFLAKVATTDIERNWIVWYACAGQFNHDNEEAVPPYLRAGHFQRSMGASTETRFLPQNIFQVMGEARPETWTHYNFSDVIDWMAPPVQKHLLLEAHRTATPGARLVYRSVEDACLVDRLGLDKKWRRIEPASSLGSAAERTRLYRRTNFYERCA
jgi:S-adenosylmethionine-diacylglycerol 3-amino-3-carboxypropyl transferase